ncbi:unnamed protein product [Somion occarium]|uniref:F-box domain-containing protein n=1 Tax=Somion occarium TaxID=3059160 RepID=A0ABP1DXH8_9APHY
MGLLVYEPVTSSLPADIITPILEQLADRRDLGRCALVNSVFHRAAIPLLYRTLDVKTKRQGYESFIIVHPSKTLLRRPEYAKYVRYVRETATVGFYEPKLISDCRKALRMCINLRSFTWVDDAHDTINDDNFLAYLSILRSLPRVIELIIRTSAGISDEVWSKLTEFTGLHKIAIWCLHGKARVLQGWSEQLGSSLTHLELGVSDLSRQHPNFLSHLPGLKTLRLKGAPSNSIPEILSVLPNLVSLDTEYLGAGRIFNDDQPAASLRELTVRTSSVDLQGPPNLWPWIASLIPRPSLETLKLHTFSTQGDMSMPRMFLLDLAKTHKHTLKHFNVNSVQLTLQDIECLCTMFPNLETVSCSLAWCKDHNDIKNAIANGHNLRSLQLSVHWGRGSFAVRSRFNDEEAKEWMLRENSRLRQVGLGDTLYIGKWVRKPTTDGKTTTLEFEVLRDVVQDSWI